MNNKIILILSLITVTSVLIFASGNSMEKLTTVDFVEVEKYMGLWYEIANYPNSFQKNCFKTMAEYTLLKNGDVEVVNRCRKKSLDGKANFIKGKAWVYDKQTNAKFKVQFFWPFSGNYWVIDLRKNYEYAVVGELRRKFLWILSRTPQMDEKLYNKILGRVEQKGYDLKKIVKTVQIK